MTNRKLSLRGFLPQHFHSMACPTKAPNFFIISLSISAVGALAGPASSSLVPVLPCLARVNKWKVVMPCMLHHHLLLQRQTWQNSGGSPCYFPGPNFNHCTLVRFFNVQDKAVSCR